MKDPYSILGVSQNASDDEVKTYQSVYFYCGFDGIILTDGEEVYYYNSTWSDRQKNTLSAYVSEEVTSQIDELSDSELSTVVEKTANLLEDLAMAYTQAGMNVTVDPATGEIAMDSTVLFEVNESEISEEGKVFLQQFVTV